MASRLGMGFSYRLASRAAWGSLTGTGVVFFFDKMFLVSTRQEGRERLGGIIRHFAFDVSLVEIHAQSALKLANCRFWNTPQQESSLRPHRGTATVEAGSSHRSDEQRFNGRWVV